MSELDWLDADAIAAIARHMNDDHAGDNVVICRGLGGRADTERARFDGMTTREAIFTVTVTGGAEHEIRVLFANAVTSRPEVRAEVAALYHRSAALLGLAPRL